VANLGYSAYSLCRICEAGQRTIQFVVVRNLLSGDVGRNRPLFLAFSANNYDRGLRCALTQDVLTPAQN
jgi:hypothetical protein